MGVKKDVYRPYGVGVTTAYLPPLISARLVAGKISTSQALRLIRRMVWTFVAVIRIDRITITVYFPVTIWAKTNALLGAWLLIV